MADEGPSLGEQLLAKGWKQGCLLSASAPVLSWERVPGPPPEWKERTRDMEGSLVLATQTCDLKKHPAEEPTVEFLRAFWTTKERITVPAGRNSVRYFLLCSRLVSGKSEGLVAEASKRLFVDKRSLLLFEPEQACGDARTEARFRRWLARRYDRPAVPDPVVLAVQKPVVEALRAAPAGAEVWTLLRGVREVLFDTAQAKAPFKVRLLFVREEGLTDVEPITDPDAERLAAWFREALAAGDDAELDEWDAAGTGDISVRDYFTFIALPLDEYSL